MCSVPEGGTSQGMICMYIVFDIPDDYLLKYLGLIYYSRWRFYILFFFFFLGGGYSAPLLL